MDATEKNNPVSAMHKDLEQIVFGWPCGMLVPINCTVFIVKRSNPQIVMLVNDTKLPSVVSSHTERLPKTLPQRNLPAPIDLAPCAALVIAFVPSMVGVAGQ